MALSETELAYLEERIPELTRQATRQAFFEALAAGNSVLIAEEGQLIEVFPDGRRQVIKPLASKPRPVTRRTYTIE